MMNRIYEVLEGIWPVVQSIFVVLVFVWIGRWFVCYDFPDSSKIISGSEACSSSLDSYILWCLLLPIPGITLVEWLKTQMEEKNSDNSLKGSKLTTKERGQMLAQEMTDNLNRNVMKEK
jgi:hypothetical protein